MEYIDGSIRFHVLLHVDECTEQELVELIIRHIVVLDFPSRFFHVDVVRRVRQYQVGLLPVHQPCIGFRQGGIPTDDAVVTEEPDIAASGKSRLFQLPIHIKVIFLDFLIVDFGKELLYFRGLETRQIHIEIDTLQIHDKVSQELFVPGPGDFIERDVKSLYLVFVLDMDKHALDILIAQVLQHIEPLVAADDCHVVVDDDRFHVAEFLDGVLDFFVFLVAGLQLFPGIVGRGFQLPDRQGFPFHIRCLHVPFPFRMPQQRQRRTRSNDASGSNSVRCPVTASFPGRWPCSPSPFFASFLSTDAGSHP